MAVWLNIFSWFWHGKMMSEIYASTASLWRPEAEMRGDLIGLGLLISAFFSTFIFMKGYEGAGMKEGIRFGIIMSLLFLGCTKPSKALVSSVVIITTEMLFSCLLIQIQHF